MTLSESASLTPEQLRVAVAERLGIDLYVIVKNGLYYRPDAAGYTSSMSEAWKIPYAQAKKYEMYADRDDVAYCDKVLLEKAPYPNYPESLDACEEFEKLIDSLPMDTRSKYLDLLALTFDWPETNNAADLRFEVQYRTVRASATQRCRAFLAVTSEVTENRNE